MTRRYRCPACAFTVFNRRLADCEACGAPLPPEFRFTAQQIAALEAEHDLNDKVRAALAREAAELALRRARRRQGD